METLNIPLEKKMTQYSYSEIDGYVKITSKVKQKNNQQNHAVILTHRGHDLIRSLKGI